MRPTLHYSCRDYITFGIDQDLCLEHRDLQMTHILFVSEMSHRIEHDIKFKKLNKLV